MSTSTIDRIEGPAIALRGNNIDTDRIIPARYLKAITFEGLGDHVFEDDRKADPAHPFSNSVHRGAAILLANGNFGSGSSREHAPQALKRWGIAACVAESFSEIFRGNSVAIGLPCATASQDVVERLMQLAESAPDTKMILSVRDLVVSVGSETFPVRIPAADREALLNGFWDATGLLLDRFDEVRAVASRLPYLNGF
jgi:3-isopropylmalate/(R)-2-methylmalate dehydratase small subunit